MRKVAAIQGTRDPELYSNQRWGNFTYSIPVVEGDKYRLTLKFAETFYGPGSWAKGGVGSRLFDVYCNGVALLRDFDIYKEAGGENQAANQVFHGLVPNRQGRLMLSFAPARRLCDRQRHRSCRQREIAGSPSTLIEWTRAFRVPALRTRRIAHCTCNPFRRSSGIFNRWSVRASARQCASGPACAQAY